MGKFAFFTLFLFGLTSGLLAQTSPVQGENNSLTHSLSVNVKEHNPNKALLLSAIVPGAGQVYNKQAWKIPIIYAAIGGVAYYTYNNYTLMSSYKEEYLYRVNNNDNPLDPSLAQTPTANIYNLYQAYDKTFQLSVIVTVAVYGLNLLDAYVFGHLFDFQIDDNISLHLEPKVTPRFSMEYGNNSLFHALTTGAAITISF